MRRMLAIPAVGAAMWLFGPTAVAPPATAPGPPITIDGRHFLEYDTRGDGLAVEAVGDLARAGRVAIIVPGVDTRLDNFDRGPGPQQCRAPSFQARQLYGQLGALAPEVTVAVVAWLGYDPPEGVRRDAIREDRAAAGAVALRSFVDSLVSANPNVAITIIGHSYGSVVAGLAAPSLSHRVVNIIAIGSPGMGVDRAADLHTTAQVWAGTAPGDWTHWIPGIRILGAGHGTQPTDPSFGAHLMPVGGVENHDGYFVSGTAALRAMAEITLGRL